MSCALRYLYSIYCQREYSVPGVLEEVFVLHQLAVFPFADVSMSSGIDVQDNLPFQ